MKQPTVSQLCDVWNGVIQDREAREALNRLQRDGFHVAHLKPRDPTLKRPNWADYIAAIPFLSNRPSRSRIHRSKSLRRHLSLVSTLRRLAENIDDPFCEVRIVGTRDHLLEEIVGWARDVTNTADFLETLLSWGWYTRFLNSRNHAIAVLRWQIRERTSAPHDRDLGILIDAAFRAAGRKEGLYLDATTLDRIEKRETEGRVSATRRLRSVKIPNPICKSSTRPASTTFSANRRKPV